MHCITKEEAIVFYNLCTRRSITKTKDAWIKLLAQTIFQKWIFPINGISSDLMDQIQVTGKDLCVVPDFIGGRLVYGYALRPYLFYEEFSGRTVDPRTWLPEILAEHCTNYYTKKRNLYLDPAFRGLTSVSSGFRREPVPGCGRKRHRYKHFLRHVSTMNERRINSDPETACFVRAARKANVLPNFYDDLPRCNSRSWKKQSKCRHQWEKNLR